MTSIPSTSLDITSEKLAQLQALFPNVFSEGKLDFDALKAELGEHLEGEGERYQFTWNGKAQAKRIATTPSMGTLRPARDDSVNWDSTENLYIEGDNLEVLKLLQKAYFGKVKMIYIDPPYNTGKDFVYKDDFKDNLSNYKRLTKQVDDAGNPLTTNSDSSGRYHSNWLNMMYPRLKFARNLLRDDGVIFISIDDNEVHNLRKLCDEIFGEEHFVGMFKWNKTSKAPTLSKTIRNKYEYVLCYEKRQIAMLKGPSSYNEMAPLFNSGNSVSRITFPPNSVECWFDDGVYPAGIYGEDSKAVHLLHDLEVKERINITPLSIEARFKWSQSTIDASIDKGQKFAFKTPKFVTMYYYLDTSEDKFIAPSDLLNQEECGVLRNDEGWSELRQLFDGVSVFDYTKPSSLIRYLVQMSHDSNGIYLDFFSGSATTAHAVMQLNADDGGNRKFILVQIPEATPEGSEARKAGYVTIAEIGKERMRRAGKKIQESLAKPPRQASPATPPTEGNGEQADLLSNSPPSEGYAEGGGWSEPTTQKLDIGFKVFKLDTSNIKAWNPTPDTLQEDLLYAVDNILSDRTDEDLMYEVLIKYGLPLTLPIETVQLGQHTGFSVGMGSLVACFAKGITLDTVQAIADMSTPENLVLRVVFRDSGFTDDNVKTNAVQRLKQVGIEDVLSI